MARVNGRKPPAFKKPEPKVIKRPCGRSLGGYIDQGVPDVCGGRAWDGAMRLCPECHAAFIKFVAARRR